MKLELITDTAEVNRVGVDVMVVIDKQGRVCFGLEDERTQDPEVLAENNKRIRAFATIMSMPEAMDFVINIADELNIPAVV